MFDILITIGSKDFNKLRFMINSIVSNIDGFNKIYVVSNDPIPDDLKPDGIIYLSDSIIDYDFNKIKVSGRVGWYRQQFIKLFQEVTLNDYLVIDSDVYLNGPLKINLDNPTFWLGENQNHKPYFEFMEYVFGLEKCYPHSFINEIMLFKKNIIRKMVSDTGLTRDGLFDLCVKEINKRNIQSGFSEYELYGNYVTKNYPDLYNYVNMKVIKYHKNRSWTDDEIKETISKNKYSRVDLISMHTWS